MYHMFIQHGMQTLEYFITIIIFTWISNHIIVFVWNAFLTCLKYMLRDNLKILLTFFEVACSLQMPSAELLWCDSAPSVWKRRKLMSFEENSIQSSKIHFFLHFYEDAQTKTPFLLFHDLFSQKHFTVGLDFSKETDGWKFYFWFICLAFYSISNIRLLWSLPFKT